jgi:hypothetical protein
MSHFVLLPLKSIDSPWFFLDKKKQGNTMPKERVQKKSRMHKEIQKEGINFNKEFGQHILKNPLILASMVEKVSFSFELLKERLLFFVLIRQLYVQLMLWLKLVQEPGI